MDNAIKYLSQFVKGLTVFVLSFQLVSCGTLLYPERRHQTAGRLDIGVVLLDAVGLLFFLIPGIIAFAVDFSSGAIYLPAKTTGKPGDQSMKKIKFDPNHYTTASLEKIIREETGRNFSFQDKRLTTTKLRNQSELPIYFAQLHSTTPIELANINSVK